MKAVRIIAICIVLVFTIGMCNIHAQEISIDVSAPSALLMDYTTGKILYEKNSHDQRPLASVTKVMTMLLAMEEISAGNLSYDDTITGSAHAKSYGGSTIFLDEGEQMSVRDIIKGIAVASGNDAAVALGEHISGSEEAFVQRMNQKAKELGMKDTNFVNCNGLDADGHYSCAYDIALMSRELMKYNDIFEFTTIWMDSLRNGQFTLSNTNKLVRFYEGATGLKTGSTSKAGFCISATAKRDNLHLICVIMGAETSKKRQADASTLLNYGFANYAINNYVQKDAEVAELKVEKGISKTVKVITKDECSYLGSKNEKAEHEKVIKLDKKIKAPVQKGDLAGSLVVNVNGKEFKKIDLICAESIEKVSYGYVLRELLTDWLC